MSSELCKGSRFTRCPYDHPVIVTQSLSLQVPSIDLAMLFEDCHSIYPFAFLFNPRRATDFHTGEQVEGDTQRAAMVL